MPTPDPPSPAFDIDTITSKPFSYWIGYNVTLIAIPKYSNLEELTNKFRQEYPGTTPMLIKSGDEPSQYLIYSLKENGETKIEIFSDQFSEQLKHYWYDRPIRMWDPGFKLIKEINKYQYRSLADPLDSMNAKTLQEIFSNMFDKNLNCNDIKLARYLHSWLKTNSTSSEISLKTALFFLQNDILDSDKENSILNDNNYLAETIQYLLDGKASLYKAKILMNMSEEKVRNILEMLKIENIDEDPRKKLIQICMNKNRFLKNIYFFEDLRRENTNLLEKMNIKSDILSEYIKKLHNGEITNEEINMVFSMYNYWNKEDIRADLVFETIKFIKDKSISQDLREKIYNMIDIKGLSTQIPAYEELRNAKIYLLKDSFAIDIDKVVSMSLSDWVGYKIHTIEIFDYNGNTALEKALENKYPDKTPMLIKFGNDPAKYMIYCKNQFGDSEIKFLHSEVLDKELDYLDWGKQPSECTFLGFEQIQEISKYHHNAQGSPLDKMDAKSLQKIFSAMLDNNLRLKNSFVARYLHDWLKTKCNPSEINTKTTLFFLKEDIFDPNEENNIFHSNEYLNETLNYLLNGLGSGKHKAKILLNMNEEKIKNILKLKNPLTETNVDVRKKLILLTMDNISFIGNIYFYQSLQNENLALTEKLDIKSEIVAKYRKNLQKGVASKEDIWAVFTVKPWDKILKTALIEETINFLKEESTSQELKEKIYKMIEIDKIPSEVPFYKELRKAVELYQLQQTFDIFTKEVSNLIYLEDSPIEDEEHIEYELEKDKARVIYNNEGFATTEPPTDSKYVKGSPLFLDEPANTIPIGYNMLLPQPPREIKNVIVNIYGGGTEPYEPNGWRRLHYNMLRQGTAIITLNMSDLTKLKVFQDRMSEELFKEVQDSIHKFYTTLTTHPETLDPKLAQLDIKNKPMYLMGQSFGGLMTIKHAELHPKTFQGYISQNGALSNTMSKKSDFESMGRDKIEIQPWLDPADENEIPKISEPLLLLHTRDDSNVNAKVTLDFYNKANKLMKKDLVRVCITHRGAPMPSLYKDRYHKGHTMTDKKKAFKHIANTLSTFLAKPSSVPAVSEWRAYKEDALANRFYRSGDFTEKFCAEALALYKKRHHQNKDLDSLWDEHYKPLLYAMTFSEVFSSNIIGLFSEIQRLKTILTDEMIVKTLLSQADIFSQFVKEATTMHSFKFSKDLDMASLLTDKTMIMKFREYISSLDSKNKAERKYLLEALYKANPELLQDLYAMLNKKATDNAEKIEKENFKKIIKEEKNKIKNAWKEASIKPRRAIIQKWQDTVHAAVKKDKQTQFDVMISNLLKAINSSNKSEDFTHYYVDLLNLAKNLLDEEGTINNINQKIDKLIDELKKLPETNNAAAMNIALALLSKAILTKDQTKIQEAVAMVTKDLIHQKYPAEDVKQLIESQCKQLQEAVATTKSTKPNLEF